MKYMLSIYDEERAVDEEARERCYQESAQLSHDLHATGQPVSTPATVRVHDSKPLVTGGPFAETHVQPGGYYLIAARDWDQAINLDRPIPGAQWAP